MTPIKTRVFRACCLLVLAISVHAQAIPGQPGTLDATWGGTGQVATSVSGNSYATAMTLQPDGKVLVAGYCSGGGNADFCATRYNTNGTLDLTWNGTGKVITAITPGANSADDFARAIALQPDGKVLLAGSCGTGTVASYTFGTRFCATRYNADGTLDLTWNGTGAVTTVVSTGLTYPDDYANAIALQPDGKVLLAGACYDGTGFANQGNNYNFCAVRYNSNGTLDTTWNSTGTVKTVIGINGKAFAATVFADGKVLLAGSCAAPNYDFCSIRYTANGSLDVGWNGTGKVTTDFAGGSDAAHAIAVQPDGKIVLAGRCTISNPTLCAIRYDANGAVNKKTTSETYGEAWAVAVQPDGKMLLAGLCGGSLCAFRFQPYGPPDLGWTDGSIVSNGTGAAMALQPDGKVLLAGDCQNTSVDFCVARFDGASCAVDLDGDTKVLATIDSLMHVRIALGLTGAAVTNGINFPVGTPRNDWASISNYLVGKTLDIDGDGLTTASVDSVIHARVALGLTGDAVMNGIVFPIGAARKTWPLIRDYLVTQCGMSLAP